jgi:hypothetical protein
MINSFSQVNIGVFVELERIKKPSAIAYQTGKMFCMFANTFKGRPIEENIDSWPKI